MDFSQVKAITIPEGNVLRILSGATVLWERTGLPAEYQEVEYLESTGTQYIDTGYYPNQDTVLNGKYYSDNRAGNIATARWSGSPQYDTFGFYVGGTGLTTVYYGRYSDGKYSSNIGGMTNIDVDISIGITSITLNNDQYTINRDQFQSSCSLYLFAGNNMGVLTTPAYCKIYRMTIIENNVTMRDFIPCYRKIDKKPGLYDITNGVFYTNAGTGEFNVGADVIVLPADYQRVEYIESSGTQYIDTGMALNNGCVITLDFLMAESSVNRIVYGWRRKGLFTQPYQAYITSNTRKIRQIAIGRSADTDTYPQSFEYGVRNKVLIDSVDEQVLVNGIAIDCGPDFSNGKAFDENGSSEYHPYLFALNNAGRAVAISQDTRIYGYSVQYEGELLQSFVPCYRKIDKVAGMYDVVNGVFYTNKGTRSFTVGPDIITIPSGYQKVEYIQSTGTQYIQTSVTPNDNFRMDLRTYTTCGDSYYCAGVRASNKIWFGQTGTTTNNRVSASVNGTSVNASTNGVLWSRSTSGQTYEIMLCTNGNGTFTYHIKDLTNNKESLTENREYTLMGEATNGICLFALNKNYIISGTNQIYYFRLYKNGKIAFDGIPCYRRSDNVVGLYDLVSKNLLVNSGTGSLTPGPDIT